MTRLPSLGPRGEGWLVLQIVMLWVVVALGLTGPAWDGTLRVVTSVAGAGLVLGGLGLALRGVIDLRSALSPLPHPRLGAVLVENGAYRLVRHPIYAGLVLGAVGWALLTAAPLGLLAAAGLLTLLDLKSRREEAWLLERYPAYGAYCRRTRRLIPGLY
jgi:protein-S-isoprenylcysteine O-methyltransferase Ste14